MILPRLPLRTGILFSVLVAGLLAGGTVLLPASNEEVEDHDTSPYHLALLDYKSGKLDEALASINAAEKAKPGDVPVEILKARILTEMLQFDDAAKLLEGLDGKTTENPVFEQGRLLALGDLNLRRRHFDEAAASYQKLLAQTPGDPDLTLKLVYTRVSVSDFVTAAKLASELKPLDSEHPSYYFAKAALAQATGKTEEADEDIQTARTIYGITAANHYLKTYLQVFNPTQKDTTPANRAEPPSTNAPATNAPSAKA